MSRWTEVLDLLALSQGPPEGEPCVPIQAAFAEQALQSFEVVPRQLVDWLTQVNGSRKGPGGLFGVRPDSPDIDIVSLVGLFPDWALEGHIPVAGDGCGNFFVLTPKYGAQVAFIDCGEDMARPVFMGSSSLRIFLRELLWRDVHGGRWPHDRAYSRIADPELCGSELAGLPWDQEQPPLNDS